MHKREAQLTSKLNQKVREIGLTGAIEVKQTRGTSLPFCKVVKHQEHALLAVKHGNFVYKIPDAGFFNPFDVVAYSKQPAYVAIYFGTSRIFYLIDIDAFVHEREICGRKSITEPMAQKIATLEIQM